MRAKFRWKKIIAGVLIFCCITANATASYVVGLTNFEKTKKYTSGVFSDVSSKDWFRDNVISAYEYDLMNGKDNSKFDPSANITLAETVTMAVRIHYIYYNGTSIYFDSIDDGTSWYDPYVSYAKIEGITTEDYPNYNAPATRAEFAKILAASIDPVDLEEINIVDDGAIPDVPVESDYAEAVYLLYRAGILTGSDELGSFKPASTITRAEAAAIITRIVDPSLRQSIELVGEY